jgi:predicted RND superfamily exporter protein
MRDYQAALLKRYGYSSTRGCGRAELCPALSLPDLFRTNAAAGNRAAIRALLDSVPPYFSSAVITADRKTANLAFGIRLESLERQQQIIDAMRARLDPPAGVTARLAGLPVLGAEANAALSDPVRRLGTLVVGLLAVLVVLLLVHRRRGRREAWARAWVPVVPIALATGWSALVLWLLGIPLNPLSATLGALVLAISTEFAVLLSARFEAERAAGGGPAEALRRTYRSTGAAVLASGATAIAGFAVLALSDVAMLRDFGLVTVVDLTVSLLGVLAVLPAVLMLAERRAALRRAPEPAAAVPA